MAQLTVRIPDDLHRALEAEALKASRKRSEIVRMALQRYLMVGTEASPAERVRELLGSLETGAADLLANQREAILESLTRGR